MILYSKNGSIPKPETDGTEGWIEVEEAPIASEGQEVVWWYPPGWVIRPVMPVKAGFKYSWSQSEEKWVEYEEPTSLPIQGTVVDATDGVVGELAEVTAVMLEQSANETVTITDVVLDLDETSGAVDTVTFSSSEPTISLDLGTGSDTVTGSATPTI